MNEDGEKPSCPKCGSGCVKVLDGMTAIELMNHMTNAAKGPEYDGDETYDEEDASLCAARRETVVISPDGDIVNGEGYAKGEPKPFPVPSGGIVVADTSADCRTIQNMMSVVKGGEGPYLRSMVYLYLYQVYHTQ